MNKQNWIIEIHTTHESYQMRSAQTKMGEWRTGAEQTKEKKIVIILDVL